MAYLTCLWTCFPQPLMRSVRIVVQCHDVLYSWDTSKHIIDACVMMHTYEAHLLDLSLDNDLTLGFSHPDETASDSCMNLLLGSNKSVVNSSTVPMLSSTSKTMHCLSIE